MRRFPYAVLPTALAAAMTMPPPTTAQLPPRPADVDRDADPQPQLYVAQRSLDLGEVLEGDKVTITWQLENRGSADLVIDRTAASCGCTVVQLADDSTMSFGNPFRPFPTTDGFTAMTLSGQFASYAVLMSR